MKAQQRILQVLFTLHSSVGPHPALWLAGSFFRGLREQRKNPHRLHRELQRLLRLSQQRFMYQLVVRRIL